MKKMKLLPFIGLGLTLFLIKPHMIYGNATFGGGSGTENDPYRLSTPEHLTELQVAVDGGNTFSGKYFALTNDINLEGYDNDAEDSNGNFEPIGEANNNAFSGYLDGKGNSVSNVRIVQPSHYTNTGLFACLNGSKISNFKLENIEIRGGKNAGGLSGTVENSILSELSVTGEVDGYDNVGGVIGYGDNVQLTNIESGVHIVGESSRNGGIVGFLENESVMRNNRFTGVIEGAEYVGGLVGTVIFSQIIDSESNGIIKGNHYIGGLVGALMQESFIDNSSTTGQVEGRGNVGGLVGALDTSVINTASSSSVVIISERYGGGLIGYGSGSTINNSSAHGEINGSKNVGGFVGFLEYSEVTNAYSTGEVIGSDYVGGFAGMLNNVEGSNNYSIGDVVGNQMVGGFVGGLDSSLINQSFASGCVKGNQMVGGFVGSLAQSAMSNSYAKGDVAGDYYVGGLAGLAILSPKISNSYSISNIVGKSEVGGLVGSIYSYFDSGEFAILENSYHDGAVTGATISGAIIGSLGYYYNEADTWLPGPVSLDNIYYNQEKNPDHLTIGDSTHGTVTKENAIPLTTIQMSQGNAKNYMTSLDFENIWVTTSTTPMFQWQNDLIYPNQDDIQINGTVQTMIADVTIPSVSPNLVINPNLPEGVVFPEFSVSNDSVSPIKLDLKNFEQTTNTFNDVLPSKYDSWVGLNKQQSQDIALGLIAKEGEGWQTLTTPTSYVANHAEHEIGIIKPTSTVDFSFDVKHGTSFSEAKTVQYRMVFVFDLMN